MKTIHFQIILLLFFSFLFCSCNHYYYAPEEGHLLGLGEEGDAKISVGGGTASDGNNNSDKGSNFTLQAGYSPKNHIGIQASHFTLKKTEEDSNGKIGRGNGSITSGAIGAYYFFKKNHQKNHQKLLPGEYIRREIEKSSNTQSKRGVLLDLYAGYGFGNVHNFYSNGSNSHLSFQKQFLQGGIHFQGRYLGFSYSLKGVRLDYEKGVVNGELDNTDFLAIQGISQNNPFLLFENSFRFHAGLRQCRFFMTMNFINESNYNDRLDLINSSFHVGLILELDEFFTKQE